jgi:hypothetical protein
VAQRHVLYLGEINDAQPCMCQKHPLTLMTLRNRGNTRSGVPGSDRTWRRYR